jgi:anti-anti-sigma regulatory factor
MRILTRIDPMGPVTLLVIGGVYAACLADFDRAVVSARRLGKGVRIDLSQLTVIDRSCLQYLFDLTSTGVAFIGCPPHIRQQLVDSASGWSSADL